MAPGAGKTFAVEAMAMLFENTGPNTAMVITEQNVTMVAELVGRLRAAMPDTLVVRIGYDHSNQEDGWAAAWEEAANEALDLEVRAAKIVEELIDSLRQSDDNNDVTHVSLDDNDLQDDIMMIMMTMVKMLMIMMM